MGIWGKSALARAGAVTAVGAVLVSGAAPAHALTVVTQAMTRHDGPRERAREQERARSVAAAATWRVDPALLRPHPTDSATTTAARGQLALVADRLRARTTAYEAALRTAQDARAASVAARTALRAARVALRDARQQYRRDRTLLVSAFTGSYSMTRLAPLATVLSGADGASTLADLTRLEELGRIQTGRVEAADRSRQRLGAAELARDAAAQEAEARLGAARRSLADAARERGAVLREVRRVRAELAELADADLAARDAAADGYRGAIAFPLAPGTPYRDLDNFGARSRHWATTHTGDDLSAACGAPVVAATDGTVMVRTDQRWAGRWLVIVSTATGSLATWYAHMQALAVADGQQVAAGDALGEVGQEGNATGCHLHFEVHPEGGSIYADDTDPAAWLDAMGVVPS
ncbi:MAG TPA: M23 family metallopeptidase [Nocardioides sp.]|nr:M23 family metallopeptidase [Nocardioides sp.]